MHIWIPYNTTGIGGPYTFVRLFSDYLKGKGYSVSHTEPKDFDALFIIADCPLRHVFKAKRAGKPIIQRLDGVYYPALPGWKGRMYRIRNMRQQIIHNYLTDQVVYQSKFCQKACLEFLGHPKGAIAVIYNGVDIPTTPLSPPQKMNVPLHLVTFARFRRPSQIQPLIDAVHQLNISYHLDIYGPHTKDIAAIFTAVHKDESITYHGPRKHKAILAALSSYDVMLFSDLSWCPNAVLEAQAAGLPVVSFQLGGAAELIAHKTSGYLVPISTFNYLRQHHDFTKNDLSHFAHGIRTVAKDLRGYRQRAYAHAQKNFSFNQTASNYAEIIQRYTK